MGTLFNGSLIFLALGLLAFFLVSAIYRNDKDSRALAQLSVALSTGCMFIMWATCYLHQLNPLIRPIKRLE